MLRFVRVLGVVAVVLGLQVAAAGPADAAGERIVSYQIDVELRQDGGMHVRETIVYDFGDQERHGIRRRIPFREAQDAGHDRVFAVSGVTVTSPDGAPAQTEVRDAGDLKVIRVGDPSQTVTGVHTYVIDYDVADVVTDTGGGILFAWDAVGTGWDVPITDILVRLTAPAELSGAACFAGAAGATAPCDQTSGTGAAVEFSQSQLAANQGLTVQADLPAGSVEVTPHLVAVDRGGDGWYDLDLELPAPWLVAVQAVVLVAIAAVALPTRRRRGRTAAPPRPSPPEGMSPALAAWLTDRGGKSARITATLFDLARRGYLRIDQEPGKWGREDWTLTATTTSLPALERYEMLLLYGLFSGRGRVSMRALGREFARTTVAAVDREIRGAARARGWANNSAAYRFVKFCGAVLIVATPLSFLLVARSWVPLPVSLAVLATLVRSRLAPRFRLSHQGEALRRDVEAYRAFLAADPHAGTGDPRAASAHLAYAAALGLSRQWDKRWSAAGRPQLGWYSGTSLAAFSASASAVWTPPSSGGGSGSSSGGGGGGSVGGGGGGGGGGSW